MRWQRLAASVAAATLLVGVSACGGSNDDKAKPKPTRTTASASPTPTTPAQPQGSQGVTIDIQNWDIYAADPAVLAWKQTTEVFTASGNQGKILPGMRDGYSKAIFRRYVRNLKDYVWKNDWHITAKVPAKVQSSRTVGSKTDLVACLWAPAYALRKKNGALVVKTPKSWIRERTELKSVGGRWIITKITIKGDCPGAAPR